MKHRFVIVFMALTFVNPLLFGSIRQYNITDLKNNKRHLVSIHEDYFNRKIYILLSEGSRTVDSLVISEATNILSIKEFDNRFIIVNYKRRGGSNSHESYTSIFCLTNSRLINSLTLLSKSKFLVNETFVPKFDSIKGIKATEDYNVILKLAKLYNKYILKIKESYISYSIFDSLGCQKWNNRCTLAFNNDCCFFYSSNSSIPNKISINYWNGVKENKELDGNFDIVELKLYKYIRIKSKWFLNAQNDLWEI